MSEVGPNPIVKRLPHVLRDYWIAIVVLAVLALTITSATGTLFLYPPEHHFADMKCYEERFLNYGTAVFYDNTGILGITPWTLPATVAVLYEAYFSQPYPIAEFLSTVAVVLCAATAIFIILLRRRGLSTPTAIGFGLTALLTSYPLWHLIECANMEFFVLMFVSAGIICYMREKNWWAAACFGAATALKLTPVIYFALFLTRRDYRKLAFGLLVSGGLFLLAHWMVGPSLPIALRGTQSALATYNTRLILEVRPNEITFDHSLFGVVKQVYAFARVGLGWRKLQLVTLYRGYLVAAAMAALMLAFKIRHLPRLNQVLAVTAGVLLLTPVSWDYRLTHLIVPWALLVLYVLDEERSDQFLVHLLLLFAVLFTPQNFLLYRIPGTYGPSVDIGFGGLVKAIGLMLLIATVLRHPLESSAPLNSADRSEMREVVYSCAEEEEVTTARIS